MLRETGPCHGVENYSRHLARRPAGSRPWTLLDYFPPDFLAFVDESHISLPQVRGMYGGDRSRKEILVDYGFRLPSALDNRPLTFAEFEQRLDQAIYVSATPGPYELEHSSHVVEQIIRPTVSSIRRSRCAKPRGRSTISSRSSTFASRGASARSSRRSRRRWPRISPTTFARWASRCSTCTRRSRRSNVSRSSATCVSACTTSSFG